MTRPLAPVRPARDLRLDFFRGILQLSIFIAHIPGDLFVLLLHRNFGFSDSSEIFVLTSGLTLGSVFAFKTLRDGYWSAVRDLAARIARLYRRHLLVAAFFILMVMGSAALTNHAVYLEEIQLAPMLAQPARALARLAVLDYQPTYIDILPLFVVLMPLLALVLAVPPRRWYLALLPSMALYGLVQLTGIAPATWPDGKPWTFNPLAWQLLFVIGALIGRASLLGQDALPRSPALTILALGFCAIAGVSAFSGSLHYYVDDGLPTILDQTLTPYLGKVDLAPLVVLHALALIYLIARFCPADASFFRSRLAAPIIEMGRYSLEVFCVRLFLSFLCHVLLTTLDGGLLTQGLASLGGCLLLCRYARQLDGTRAARRRMATRSVQA